MKSKEMCDKDVDGYSTPLEFVQNQYKFKETRDKILSDDPFSLTYVTDQFKTQQMCYKAVDDCLAALKCVLIGLLQVNLYTTLYADENMLCFNEDFGNVVFNCNEMGTLHVDLNCINLDNNNFDENDPDTIIHVRLFVGILNLKNVKHLKKYPNKWWNWCVSEDEKKEVDPMFNEEL